MYYLRSMGNNLSCFYLLEQPRRAVKQSHLGAGRVDVSSSWGLFLTVAGRRQVASLVVLAARSHLPLQTCSWVLMWALSCKQRMWCEESCCCPAIPSLYSLTLYILAEADPVPPLSGQQQLSEMGMQMALSSAHSCSQHGCLQPRPACSQAPGYCHRLSLVSCINLSVVAQCEIVQPVSSTAVCNTDAPF